MLRIAMQAGKNTTKKRRLKREMFKEKLIVNYQSNLGMQVSMICSFKQCKLSILKPRKTFRKIIVANLFNRQPALALA